MPSIATGASPDECLPSVRAYGVWSNDLLAIHVYTTVSVVEQKSADVDGLMGSHSRDVLRGMDGVLYDCAHTRM